MLQQILSCHNFARMDVRCRSIAVNQCGSQSLAMAGCWILLSLPHNENISSCYRHLTFSATVQMALNRLRSVCPGFDSWSWCQLILKGLYYYVVWSYFCLCCRIAIPPAALALSQAGLVRENWSSISCTCPEIYCHSICWFSAIYLFETGDIRNYVTCDFCRCIKMLGFQVVAGWRWSFKVIGFKWTQWFDELWWQVKECYIRLP